MKERENVLRVLHIMAGADAGGISTVVLNFYQYLDRATIHFDVAVTTDTVGQNARYLQQLGARIYRLPLKSQGVRAYERALAELLREHAYDAIHVHENETSYIALRVAKRMGIRCRIAHSHTTSPSTSWHAELRRLSGCVLNYHYATTVIGCGRLAGERVFGKINMRRRHAVVLPNAIDTSRFCYDQQLRTQLRRELQLEDRYVVGMVGRLALEKNHMFALDFFRAALDALPNAHLLLIGCGEEEARIRAKIEKDGISACVTLLGRRDDVASLYQAMDALILPSLSEGFPVAAVEGMATGLPVLLSDRITPELSFGTGVRYLPLRRDAWVQGLLEASMLDGRETRQHEVWQHGLDLAEVTPRLESIYREGCR